MSDQLTLYQKVESTDDYPRWKAVYDAWVDDSTTAINLRDMAGEYFDDFMVAVEPCEHGNYAPHIDPDLDHWKKLTSDMEMCQGEPA